jgi:hypothetical protein
MKSSFQVPSRAAYESTAPKVYFLDDTMFQEVP